MGNEKELTLKELAAQITDLADEVSALTKRVDAIPGPAEPVLPHPLAPDMVGTPEQHKALKEAKEQIKAGGDKGKAAAELLKKHGHA